MTGSVIGDWWRPAPGSKAEQRVNFIGAALTIVTASFALAGLTWTLASTEDGRMKALLWWCFGITAAGAFVLFQVQKREHRDQRFARALPAAHNAHHLLRDAAYVRYIARASDPDWRQIVEESLRAFADSFSIAIGAPCHATIKKVSDRASVDGRSGAGFEELVVETLMRTADRPPRIRAGVPENTVGRNTDFRHLFSPDTDNRCWYHNDLLTLDAGVYQNPHWPDNPNTRNAPYRSTMVWPIRKVLRAGSTTSPVEMIVHGFLTVDSPEPNVFRYERHFDLGAAYADHLLSVLWDPAEFRRVHAAVFGGQPPVPEAREDDATVTAADVDGATGDPTVDNVAGGVVKEGS